MMIRHSTNSPAVEVDLTEAGYQDKTILKNVRLTVRQGEFLALLGENGAGKTTLFRAILQLLPLQKGSVRVLGREIAGKENRSWVRAQIGYVPQRQEKGRFPISVFDAVLLGRWGKTFSYLRRPQRQDREAVDAMLETIGLGALRNADCRALSGGQMQRLNIARALVREPKILMLDEPTTHLDTEAQAILHECIEQVREQSQITVMMISHDQRQAERIADRLIWLQQGQITEEASGERS